MAELPWWKTAVVYQIYPRSFADADGDGVGDLTGVLERLEHLTWLGVDAIWLSPFYRSPMADFGYDVADHCDVDPLFGSLEDAQALVDAAHEAGIRVIVDFVPNHTSDQHPWFVESRRDRSNDRRTWYYWRDPAPGGGVPNNWRASFTGETSWVRNDDGQLRPRWGLADDSGDADVSAWSWDEATGQYYLHTFLPEQPDLDWHNPEVVAAQHDVLRFWLDRGVDGVRVDAIITLGKPEGLPDAIEELALIPEAGLTDERFAQTQVRALRALVDSYEGDRLMVGEVGGIDLKAIHRYVTDDLFHLAFNFPPMFDRWQADRWKRHVEESEAHGAEGPWPAWVLSNHDAPRHAERYGSESRSRAAAVLMLGLRGTAFIYAGEELGLRDAEVPPEQWLDPGGRDGCRAPLPWTDAADHGWGPSPWLPFATNAQTNNVERLRDDSGSILWLYRRLLAARRASPALLHGKFSWVASDGSVLAWRRSVDDPPGDGPRDQRLIAVNFAGESASIPLPEGSWVIEVASDGDGTEVGAAFDGTLGPDQAVVAQPAP